MEGGNITITAPGKVEFRAGMKVLEGGASASGPDVTFARAALRMPKQPLEVSLTDADGNVPASEPMKITDGAGTVHDIAISGDSAKIDNFKPGLSKAQQTKRRN
jgi:type VI secretion system secreted protein VgrG